MSCFKKDGTIKKIYMDLVPLIENAAPYNGVVAVGDLSYKYTCRRLEVAKNKEKHITELLDELGTGYKIWPISSEMIAIDIINNDEVLNIVKQAN